MRKVTEIPPRQDHRPIELRHLRVAAYCRVSTKLEEQTSSIELQERHDSQLISANPICSSITGPMKGMFL